MPAPTILLTGASRGIGLGAVKALLEVFHANVITISRSVSKELAQLAEKHPDNLTVLQGDISDRPINFQAVATALEKHHRLDAVILNAGVLELGRVASQELEVEKWKALFDINFFSLLHTIHAVVPELRKSKGSIVFVSSGAAVRGVPGWGPYSASKAAMNSLTATLGVEESDITSIAIRPGRVNTAMIDQIRSDEGAAAMGLNEHKVFVQSEFVSPDAPGYVIAALAARRAPKELSGGFYQWNGPELKEYQPQ